MAMTNDAKNRMLDNEFGTGASSGTYMSLHSADPTTTVATALANEIAGGSPAYARKQVNFNAAASGQKTLAANVVFDIQSGDSFSYYALWEVSTSGTQSQFLGSAALTSAEGAYGSQGTYTITALTLSI
jgi:hypothetical protein